MPDDRCTDRRKLTIPAQCISPNLIQHHYTESGAEPLILSIKRSFQMKNIFHREKTTEGWLVSINNLLYNIPTVHNIDKK